MNEYRIMFSDDITDGIDIKADSFVVDNDTIVFKRLTDNDGHFEVVAVVDRVDVVGVAKNEKVPESYYKRVDY